MKVKLLSQVRLFVTPWTVAYQAPPSVGFPRQEDWSGLPVVSMKHNVNIFLKDELDFISEPKYIR